MSARDPHRGQPILAAGRDLKVADRAMILLHGRGAPAQDILSLSTRLQDEGFAYLAPQAANYSWYPYRFLAPFEHNEPSLSSALLLIEHLFRQLEREGIPRHRTILAGFSQGGCLSLEFAARNARRYGGVAGLSGSLMGASQEARNDGESLGETPVFLGCSDIDPHIPLDRVQESTRVLQRLGGQVTERIYPGMGHLVNEDELEFIRAMMSRLDG